MSLLQFPTRITVTTFNVWGQKYWPQRGETLFQTFQSLQSDIYLLQEVNPQILDFLDRNLTSRYARVQGSGGWLSESNIYWNNSLYSLVDHGRSCLEIEDYPNRGLFWVRLALRAHPTLTVFLCTVHFPWVGCNAELATGMNQRIPAAVKMCENIRKLVPPNEPAIFGGDLNDDYHPVRILNEELGMIDVFESLDLPPPITHPVRPSDPEEEMRPSRTLDWILCVLPPQCRVVAAFAKTIRGGRCPPASDHCPVMAVFEIAQ